MKTSELEVGKRYTFRPNGSKYGPVWSGEVLLTKTAVTVNVRHEWHTTKRTTGDGVQMVKCKRFGEPRHEHEPKVPETVIVRARDVLMLEETNIARNAEGKKFAAECAVSRAEDLAAIHALGVALDIPDPTCFVCEDVSKGDHDCEKFRNTPFIRAEFGGLFISARGVLPFLKRVGMDQPAIRKALGIAKDAK